MVRSEFRSTDEMPARIVYEALNEGCAVAVKHERKRDQEDPVSFHLSSLA